MRAFGSAVGDTRQSAPTELECPSRRDLPNPTDKSHNRIVLSSKPEASRPSGHGHRSATVRECPSRQAFSSRIHKLQSRMVWSEEPEARRPSGNMLRVATGPE